MIKALLIEDEDSNRELLKTFIKCYTKEVSIIGETDTVEEGVELIKELKPNLIFLDIELKDGDGFDLLNKVNNDSFLVVFVTGFEKYGMKAIRYSAFDYLLKPLVITDLVETVSKAKARLIQMKLLDDIEKNNPVTVDQAKILIKNKTHVEVIPFEDIVFFSAYGNYTHISLKDKKITAPHGLSYYKDLVPSSFCRVHKSYIVNLNFVVNWTIDRAAEITLSTNETIPLSIRKKKDFTQKIKSILRDNKK